MLQSLQQARQTAVVAATANGQTALVQGASSLEGIERDRYVRTVACIFLLGALLVGVSLWTAPRTMLNRIGLGSIDAQVRIWLLVAVSLTSAYGFLTGLLNSRGRVGTLAVLQVAGPFALALFAYPAARAGGPAIAQMVAASAAASAGAALLAITRYRGLFRGWFSTTRNWFNTRASLHFFSISTAMLITGFLGSAAVLVVRGNIVRAQGLQHTGLFDAAWSISMNQVTLVLASVQTYYLPALAAARTQKDKANEISRVLIAGTLTSAVVIAGLQLFKPWVLELLYSSAFEGAHKYLRWTLPGDYLKVSSWILSVPMLAAADMKLFLAADLAASAAFISSAYLFTRWHDSAESAAVAFLVMYAVHFIVCVLYVHFRQGIRLGNKTWAIWMAGFTLVAAGSFAGWKGGN